MNTEAQVRAAGSAQEALVILAQALDRIEALVIHAEQPTEDWLSSGWGGESLTPDDFKRPIVDMLKPREARTTFTEEQVIVPSVSEEKQLNRHRFAERVLNLAAHLGPGTDWSAAYAKGGPQWLYHGNRELVMSYPYEIRQQFVLDVAEQSPEEAHEMGRDILKHAGETGPGGTGMHIADGDVG